MEKSFLLMSVSVFGIALLMAGFGHKDTSSLGVVTPSSFIATARAEVTMTPPVQSLSKDGNDTAETAGGEPAVNSTGNTTPETHIKTQNLSAKTGSEIVPDPYDPLPSRLIIPTIDFNSPVISVGLNAKGEMDVPSGKSKNVGWYRDGTIPGDTGSAVLDAHVFAAFKRLNELVIGDDVYVLTRGNEKLHFKVVYREIYPLASVPVDTLFNRRDGKRLNLITCAGVLTKDRSTYDHRLIVYTKLVED